MKRLLRNILVALAVVLTLPLWLAVRIGGFLRAGDDLFLTCSQIISIVPGIVGIFLRRGFYRMTLESCPADCSIGCATWFPHRQVKIGNGVYIGGRCSIGMCEIGDDALIGSNVDILSGRRQHQQTGGRAADAAVVDIAVARRHQGGTFSKVHIGCNAWIGNSTVIMADVGRDCVIGAGSVVVKAIPPHSVAVGNPATVRKTTAVDLAASSSAPLGLSEGGNA